MISTDSDFRNILGRELEKRCKQNARYSLRAFARELGLSPSRVSEVLSGKQGLSRNAATKVASVIGLEGRDIELFCDLVESQHGRSQLNRDLARIRLEKHRRDSEYLEVDLDSFHIISEWYHFAILQMIGLKGFKSDPVWIARALGIAPAEATSALQRLTRLKMIENKDGKIRQLQEFIRVKEDVPSEVARQTHRQILARALGALECQSVTEREYSANLIAIDRAQLPDAKKWLRAFRRRFSQKLSRSRDKNNVYCLSMQFFNLTSIQET